MSQYRPTERQAEATKLLKQQEPEEFLMYGGGRSGKTLHACRTIWIRAQSCPGSHHLICCDTLKNVRQKIERTTMKKMLGPEMMDRKAYEYNGTFQYYTLANGSEIWLAGTGSEDDCEHILGMEFSTIFFNECNRTTNYATIELVQSRLAEQNELRNYILYDCNPRKKSGWVYLKFFKNLHPIEKTAYPEGWHLHIQMNPDHNPYIDSDYIKREQQKSRKSQKRFLKGEFSDDDEGKVFDYEDIDNNRVTHKEFNIEDLDIIVIAVDPNVKSKKGSDDCGIVIAGRKSGDRHIYILKDATLHDPKTTEWATYVAKLYKIWNASYVVAEVNQGGDLVADAIQNARDEYDIVIKIVTVHAHQGKFARADPVAGMYQLGLVHHVGKFEDLEGQMIEFDPDTSQKSPDRMDALVYVVTALTVDSGILCSGMEDEPQYSKKTIEKVSMLSYKDVYTPAEMVEMDHLFK